jgi:excisionase family DNA binding protein
MTIHEASDLIGVSPATLRRWTEAGDLEAFVTPGGHRRFSRSSILGLLPSGSKPRRTLRQLGETPEHVVRQYRREIAGHQSAGGWVQELGEADRESFREPGRRILAGVLGFLDAPTPEESERLLTGAMDASARYGALARERGMLIDAVTETFLQFRLPFLHELGGIAKRRRLPTEEAMDLLLAASRAFDRLLLRLISGYREAPTGTAASTPIPAIAADTASDAQPAPSRTSRLGRPARGSA